MKSSHDRAINAVMITGFIGGIYRFPVWTLMTLYFLRYSSLSYIDIGLIFTVQGIIPIFISPFAGHFSDRRGRKVSMIYSLSISEASFSAMLLSVLFSTGVYVIIAAFMFEGIATSMTRVFSRAMLTDLVTEGNHISLFGKQRVYVNAGIGIGMLVAGSAFQFGPSFFFLLPVLGIAIVMTLISKFVPETRPPSFTTNSDLRKEKLNLSESWKFINMSVVLGLASLVAILYMTPMFPIFFQEVDLFSPLEISFFMSVNTLVVVVFQLPVNKFAEKFGEIATISIGMMIYGACYFLISSVNNFFMVAAIIAVLSMGENMVLPMSNVIIAKLAPESRRGLYMGMNSSITGIIIPLGSLAGTSMLQYFTVHSPLTWYILLSYAIFITILLQSVSRIYLRKMAKSV